MTDDPRRITDEELAHECDAECQEDGFCPFHGDDPEPPSEPVISDAAVAAYLRAMGWPANGSHRTRAVNGLRRLAAEGIRYEEDR